ncbi:MAG: fumarate hydratase [Sulfolobales archaeon]|nr:fumarate hydratase [Sulfolobales archaeon]MCX8209069.1 fumarate hydratase [Sulfolobales archaeon]MDW8009990.1 fumarate hydratase [Sulfolobales archaeon]
MADAIERAAVEAIRRAVIYLPPDVKMALIKAYEREENDVARAQLKSILDNIELAEKMARPMCQDTGMITFYVDVGYDFPGARYVRDSLVNSARVATQSVPLRPNSVHPFKNVNTGDNTGRYSPQIHWELVPGDSLKFTVVPRGGGSEYPTALHMVPPGRGLDVLREVVLESVLRAGAMPCPPTIVGVGVGGSVETAVFIAKKAAALRKVGTLNEDPELAVLERELTEAINELGIGVMGLGGKTTVLAVHIDYAHRHPATYPVAVVFQCWAARRATAIVEPGGDFQILQ